MANSSSTSPEITSRCVTVREHTGTLNLEVTDYLGLVGIGVGEPLTSSVLEVGGYKWMISFYPDGVENFHGHAAAFVHCYFDSKDADVTAKFTLSILEKRSQVNVASFDSMKRVFSPRDYKTWGHHGFVDKAKLG
nr:BTB/POZ and MATH domain-containing protein 4-like [Aegilops tauschii subsp. strangulata]